MHRFAIQASVLFTLLWAGHVAAQEGPESRDTQKAIDRYKDYLARKPFHEFSFDKLVEAVVAKNELKPLTESYAQLVRDEPANRPAAIVLARLLARTEKLDDAVKLLESLTPVDAALARLRADLYLKRNDPKQAIQFYQMALEKPEDGKFQQEVYRSLSKAHLATGNRAQAAAALRKIAELDAGSFNTRLEVAAALAQQGLYDEASVEFAQAQELAGNDNSKKCRVLAELGKLQEHRLKLDDALATYRQALQLMGRGNWLKKDINNRILSIHKRSGTVETFITQSREEIAKQPQDVDAREFLAQVYEDSGRLAEARAVLKEATTTFPDDVRLSKHYIAVLASLKAKDELIAEYQRTLSIHPEEIDLYIELGKLFAEDRRLEQAKVQWEKLFQQKIKDADLCVRLGDLYTIYGMEAEAIAMREKAIDLQPKEIRHYSDLAHFLYQREKKDRAVAVLERAQNVAAGNPSMLEQVALSWQEMKEPARARDLLQSALALKKDDPRLLAALADVQIELKDHAGATASLRTIINVSEEINQRNASVDRIIRLAKKSNSIRALQDTERARLDRQRGDRASFLIVAKIAAQMRDFQGAVEVYEAALKADPGLEDAHKALARLLEDQGEFDKALDHYKQMIAKTPQGRRSYMREMARIHLSLFDQDSAFALYDEILKNSPDSPVAFKEVAEAYFKLNLFDKAAECYQQAIRLKPEDGRLHLDIANIYRKLGEPQKAREEILVAIRSTDDDVANSARKKYYEHLSELGQTAEEIAALRKRIDDNSYDIDAALLLTDIYIREMEYQLALDVIEARLNVQPEETKLIEQRARLLGFLDRHEESAKCYESLLKTPKADREMLALKIAEAAIEAGDLQRASEVANTVRDREKVAKLYNKHMLLDQAGNALEKAVEQNPTNPKLLLKLADSCVERGEREKAIEILEKTLALVGDDWDTLLSLGNLYHGVGRKDDAIDVGKRLFSAVRIDKRDEKEKDEERSNRLQQNNSYY
jgi:tetratricopeptide (TPR) repeat protein